MLTGSVGNFEGGGIDAFPHIGKAACAPGLFCFFRFAVLFHGNYLKVVFAGERFMYGPVMRHPHVLPWGAFAEAVDFRKFPACVEGGMGSCGELCGRYKQQASCNGR